MSDFFVGYAERLPEEIRRRVWLVIATIVLVSIGTASALVGAQSPFPASAFEFTEVRELRGTLREHPFPSLVVSRPGADRTDNAYSRYLLVGAGKHGPMDEIRGRDGSQVLVKGKLIYREFETAIELQPHTLRVLASGPNVSDESTELGPVTISGEIVDAKCFLGVMNPGEGKVHRDCASLCLRGGITPALATRNLAGHVQLYFLTDESGERLNSAKIALQAGVPVRVDGELIRLGSEMVLRAKQISALGNH